MVHYPTSDIIISNAFNVHPSLLFKISPDNVLIKELAPDFNEKFLSLLIEALDLFQLNSIITNDQFDICKINLFCLAEQMKEIQDDFLLFDSYKFLIDKCCDKIITYIDSYVYNAQTNDLFYLTYPVFNDDILNNNNNFRKYFVFLIPSNSWTRVNDKFYYQ